MKRLILSAAASLMVLAGCSHEPQILPAMAHASIPVKDVKVYTAQPKKYEWLGWVEVKGNVNYGPDHSVDAVVEDLRAQAAAKGANGLLLMTDKSKKMILSSGQYGGQPLAVPVRVKPDPAVVGQAIFVVEEK